jgi:hypothetical protein
MCGRVLQVNAGRAFFLSGVFLDICRKNVGSQKLILGKEENYY